MGDAAPLPRIARPSPAWQRAGLPQHILKLHDKHAALLGAGAFGRVYQAYDAQTDGFVAIKKMTGDAAIKTARHEYALGKTLHHPQLVQTLSMGVSPSTRREKAYLVTGLIDGRTLTTWGANPRQAIGDVLSALCYLHHRRIAHNDIHARNILVGGGRAWLIDLGCAQKLRPQSFAPIRRDLSLALKTIEEGLDDRRHSGGLPLEASDPFFEADFAALKASSNFTQWQMKGLPPKHLQLTKTAFFARMVPL